MKRQKRASQSSRKASNAFIQLQGVSAGFDDRTWAFSESFRIGRSADVDVILNDSSVSRIHAEVRLTEDGWKLQDHHSTNGTCLNGERLGETGAVLLQDDVLRCGRVVLRVAGVMERVSSEEPDARSQAIGHDPEAAEEEGCGEEGPRTHLRLGRELGRGK